METSNKNSIALVAFCALGFVGLISVLIFSGPAQLEDTALSGQSQLAAAIAVDLSTSADFAVLAGSGISNTNPSAVTGDVGLSPTTGAAIDITAGEVIGTIYDVDGAGPVGSEMDPDLLTLAKNALTAAYNNAFGQATDYVIAADLGGQTLTPGVYEDNDAPDSLGITGALTLDAQGDPDAVFIFKTGSTLTTASGSEVILINGAQACNVFWQVGSSATLGTNSTFVGNILASQSITDNGGSTIEGRLLASIGAVTLNDTTVVKATCVTPPPPPAPAAASGGSGYDAPLPLINITKIPSPLALPSGPGSVTYTYAVTNVGVVPMGGIWVRDNQCESVTFVSGDSNNDSMLDINEVWMYSCTQILSKTLTNTATAHGQANGWEGYDTANATVVVGVSVVPPLIHLVKQPNIFVLPASGGAVTYRYTVTNPGTEPLENVSVTDDMCTGLPGRVAGHPGDLNQNNLLESNEVWSFTCETNLTQTTTNTGIAQGRANGLTAIDFSSATVVVAAPGLPDTGIPGGTAPWDTLLLTGIFVVVSALLVTTVLKKRMK